MIYLFGILHIYAGIDLGARGVNGLYAGAILIPLFGTAVGFFGILASENRNPRMILKYIATSVIIMSVVVAAVYLDFKGIPFHWTGIPALTLCLLLVYRMSRRLYSG